MIITSWVPIIEFQEIVIRHLVQIQQNQNQVIQLFLTQKADAKRGESTEGNFTSSDYSVLPTIPAESVEQLKEIEKFLNEGHKELMVIVLLRLLYKLKLKLFFHF